MRAGRWTGLAVVALLLAILPGALRSTSDRGRLERALPMSLGALHVEQTTAAPDLDVPIIPPTGELTGAVAPAAPIPTPFGPARVGRPGEVFAVVIGINDYPGRRSDLGAAVADADTVDAALAGFGVPAANRVVLRDGQARRDNIVATVQALAAIGGPDTTVVFAYAGHVRKLDRDTEAMVAADGALLRDDELAALLAPSPARMWLLMAACYAGGFTEALGPGRILTAAADASSLAYESPSIHGSYLVHFLAREGWLEGHAGASVQEAFAYADAQIAEKYPQRRPLQIDESGVPMTFGTSRSPRPPQRPASSAGAEPQGEPAEEPQDQPSSPPTTEPPKTQCTLGVICRRT
ncbi:MAG: caspase family protein [Actinomycetota bacterium]